jgi:hypothetical protein
MIKLHFVGVNTNKLHDELIIAGIVPKLVESINNDTWITVQDSQEATVNTVVAAHNPASLPPQPTEADYLLDLDFRLSKIKLGI